MNATKHTTTSPEAVEVTTKSGLIDMVMTTLGFKMCPLVPPNLGKFSLYFIFCSVHILMAVGKDYVIQMTQFYLSKQSLSGVYIFTPFV